MKKTIIATILLMNFGMAEEASQTTAESNQETTQKTKQEIPKNLQDLGRGYAKDLVTNQIYYEGIQADIYSPKTFKLITEQNEKGYDGEDRYAYYKNGDLESKKRSTTDGRMDTEYYFPIRCFDDKDDPEKLLKCYQKNIHNPNYWPSTPSFWTTISPINPKDFKPMPKMGDRRFASIGQKVLSFSGYENQAFVIDNVQDLSTFKFIEKQRNDMIVSLRLDEDLLPAESEYPNEPYRKRYTLHVNNKLDFTYWYFRDKSHVYISQFGLIEKADPETFEILDYPYAQDKNYIFYRGKILSDRDGFEILDYRLEIARNKTQVFYKNQVLTDFDINTFKILSSPFHQKIKFRGKKHTLKECPIVLLMDKDKIYYTDIKSFLYPENEVEISIQDGPYHVNETYYGLVPVFLPLDYASTQVLQAKKKTDPAYWNKDNKCSVRSYLTFSSGDSDYSVGREDLLIRQRKVPKYFE